jgi:hypothetical protein
MAEFREALADCIGFSGNPWTFDNRHLIIDREEIGM